MKKQLLKESEVRKLMKFANIGALSDTFVSRLSESEMMEAEHEDEEAPSPPMDAMGDDPEADPAAAEADPMRPRALKSPQPRQPAKCRPIWQLSLRVS